MNLDKPNEKQRTLNKSTTQVFQRNKSILKSTSNSIEIYKPTVESK